MIDYLVVGLGLAGMSFCEQLQDHDKDFMVVSDDSQTSSLVAGGVYNPVILKRFTLAWNADVQLTIAMPFYKRLEEKLGRQFDHKIPILRKFASIEEQNLWFEAADKKRLDQFLDTSIIENRNKAIDAPYGLGKVLHTGRIDVKALMAAYEAALIEKGNLLKETFQFDALEVHKDHIEYKTIKAKRIVFATGFGLKSNTYFNYLPLHGNKGEVLTIKAPEVKLHYIIKSSLFIIPLGDDLYRVGSTYDRTDKTNAPSSQGSKVLSEKLQTFLKCRYDVVDHVAGIRPTVADRKPLVGVHPSHDHMFVLNGFGSRGVLIAPTASRLLYNFIENGQPIPPEMNINRFSGKFVPRIV